MPDAGPAGRANYCVVLMSPNPDSVLLIGNFDGVHVGHRRLVARAREIADASPRAEVVVLTFDPHPSVVLKTGRPAGPGRLSTLEDRAELLIGAGADRVVRLDPRDGTLDLSPEAFVERHLMPEGPRAVVEGADFRFGRRRLGGIDSLRALGDGLGFEVVVVDDADVTLGDDTVVRASSSITRWLLRAGRVRDAARVLARPYTLRGVVERGERRGRTIGFPTANVSTDQVLPGDGVYACDATLPGGRGVPAAVNVGDRPTVDGAQRTVEAHLLDIERDADAIAGLDEYGWPIRLAFRSRVRDQVRFGSLDDLTAQIERDIATVRERDSMLEGIA
ncbi:MAG: riboflavin biosynthesis protein RibF [Planctomycetota bacterium]